MAELPKEQKNSIEKKKRVRPSIDSNTDGRPIVYDDWEGCDQLLERLRKHHPEHDPQKS